MKQNKDNTLDFDADKAWNTLYSRFVKERLLPVGKPEYSPTKKRILLLQRVAAIAAVVCIGIVISVFYFSPRKDHSLISLQNKDNTGTLVATLEDGSVVYLANNAAISYPVYFAKNQRKVELSGNALFCVSKDKNRPFIVTTNGITIEVVGTVFAVNSSTDNTFQLFVKQGKVNVHSGENQTVVPVEAGETVQLSGNKLSKSGITNPQIFNRFTDKMSFKDEKLNNIIHAINTIYGSPAIVSEESINNRTLTVTFENDSIETMTELICLALNLEQINKQDTIFLSAR